MICGNKCLNGLHNKKLLPKKRQKSSGILVYFLVKNQYSYSMEKTDPPEKPSSETPSRHSQCKFKSPQIRALQTVPRDEEKENWHLLFALSPSRSIENIQPNKPSPALKLIYWEKNPPKVIWYWQHHFQPGQHSPLCLPPGAVRQSPTCPRVQEPASAAHGVSQGPPRGRAGPPRGRTCQGAGGQSPGLTSQW